MSSLSVTQLAALDAQAGWPASAIPTAVAVEEAESGGDPAAMGDVSLEDSTWGPSVGTFQIRSLWAQRGSGDTRDELANLDPATNARHALVVAGGGTNFNPWSTFTSGAYRSYLPRVQAELSGGTADTTPAPSATPGAAQGTVSATPAGFSFWDPLGLFQGIQKGTAHLVFTGLGLLLGGALIVVGAGRATGHPVTQVIGSARDAANDVAGKAAMAAAV